MKARWDHPGDWVTDIRSLSNPDNRESTQPVKAKMNTAELETTVPEMA